MRINSWVVLAASGLMIGNPSLLAQKSAAKPKPAAAAPAAVSFVDKVLDMQKAGLSEELILKAISKNNKAQDLGADDMLRLKKAGMSDRLIGALMDPSSASAPAPASSSASSSTSTSSTPAAAPANDPPPAPVETSAPRPASANNKRRVAVDPFEWGTVTTTVQAIFGTNVDVGKGIRALLTTRLQQAQKVRVLERAKIDNLMKEQDFGASNRVKKGSGAKIGGILGVEAFAMGDIVVFGRDDRKKGVAVGSMLGLKGALGGLSIGKKEEKAVVVIAYRLVDAETSEVIDTGEARGESKRTSKGIGGVFGMKGVAAGGAVDMTSSNFAETIIGEATIDAVDKLAEVINTKIGSLPAKQSDLETRVAAVSGRSLTIAAGSNDGVQAGDRFEILKVLNEIKDPVTKEVLDVQTESLGELVIGTVRERISTGTYSGRTPEVNAVARKKSQ
jgi:curli biogenesis system outer membrane secretion channel CsgG